MADVITVLRDNVAITQVAGAEVLLPLAIAASSENAGRAEAALAEIEDIASGAPDAPSVLMKANKSGDNLTGEEAEAFRLALTSGEITLTANTTVPLYTGGRYVLGAFNLHFDEMEDTSQEGIFDNSGGGVVTIGKGPVRAEWFTTRPLKSAAMAAHATGKRGVVLVEKDFYPPEFIDDDENLGTIPDITFRGKGKPTLVAGALRAEGGTALGGPFRWAATGIQLIDCGVDAGQWVCETYHAGVPQEGFTLIVPNQVALAEPYLDVEIAASMLCWNGPNYVHGSDDPDEKQYTGHCCLIEGASNPRVDHVETLGAANGLVLKVRDATVIAPHCRGHTINPIIVKSEAYAPATGNTILDARWGGSTPEIEDCGPARIEANSAVASGNKFINPRPQAGASQGISLEASPGFFVTESTITSLMQDGLRFAGVIVSGACRRTTIIGGEVNNATDDEYGNGIRVDVGAEDTNIIGFNANGTAGHGILNRGTRTKVIGGACFNVGGGKVGYRGEGASTMRLIGTDGTISGDTAENVIADGRRPFTPVFAGGGWAEAGAVAKVGDFVVNGNVVNWTVTLTPSGGGTTTSGAGSTLSGLPILGPVQGVVQAAFASTAPSIPQTGFYTSAGGVYLPTWASSSAPVIISGWYLI